MPSLWGRRTISSREGPENYVPSLPRFPCPLCILNRDLDMCFQCGGIWLDRGELERIRTFIADGGLERAQDRAIDKNRQALRELAGNVGRVQFTQRMIHFWNPKRWFFTGWK